MRTLLELGGLLLLCVAIGLFAAAGALALPEGEGSVEPIWFEDDEGGGGGEVTI